jgi:hypothetical protein
MTNLPMMPNMPKIPIDVATAVAASAVPVHQRRAGDGARMISARTPAAGDQARGYQAPGPAPLRPGRCQPISAYRAAAAARRLAH